MNTISLNRSGRLFVEYFTLNWIRDVVIFVGFFLLNIICGCINTPLTHYNIIMIVMVILLSKLFKFISDKPHGISYLLSPANIEEKFIVNILISHLYFPLLLIVPIILGYNTGGLLTTILPNKSFVFYDISLFRYRVILVFFGIQALFMFGILFFKKNGAIKTLLCLVVLLIIGIIVVVRLFAVFEDAAYYVEKNFIDNLSYDYIFHILNYVGIFTLWILSYLRLKKMEV